MNGLYFMIAVHQPFGLLHYNDVMYNVVLIHSVCYLHIEYVLCV